MPRTGLMTRKNVESLDALDVLAIQCPAGMKIHETSQGSAVHCRLEDSVITVASDVTSYVAYCCGAHGLCPTWREARHIEWQGGDVMSLTSPEGVERTYDAEDLQEIEEIEAAGYSADADVKRREVIERKRERGLVPGMEA